MRAMTFEDGTIHDRSVDDGRGPVEDSHSSDLPRLLSFLEQGLRPTDLPDGAPSNPREWLELARRYRWRRQSLPARLDDAGNRRATPELVNARKRRLALLDSDDLTTLHATVRGGTLLEQRAALARLCALARQSRAAPTDLGTLHLEPDLERDRLLWLAEGSGAASREARTTLAQVNELLASIEERVRQVVDGADSSDPIAALEPQDQAQLFLHLRSASSFLVGFLIDGLLEVLERGDAREAVRRLVAWRAAGDPRLLPTLSAVVLDNPDSQVRAEAARALARIDDARVAPTLQLAYQTASAREERLALVEAFGMQGDTRNNQFLRECVEAFLRESDAQNPEVLPPSSTRGQPHGHLGLLAALDAIFDPELVETAIRLVTYPHAEVQRAAIRAVGRIGDETALAWLDRIHEDVPAGLHGELAAAQTSILGRAELRGEMPEMLLDRKRRAARQRALTRKFSRGLDVPPTKRHRFLAWVLMIRAYLAAFLGARDAANELCERANQADPGWYVPPWYQGRLWHRAGDLARAVAGYRRALPMAPPARLHSARWISPIVQCFVLRAEALSREGHGGRAQRLLDQLWPHDLSRAAPPIRLALRRCRQHLAMSDAGPAMGTPR